ncbi:MAG TPA: sulfotransferase [Solirubrobacterales bacterium]|nr:sulfotransferase [Solirubrobacterales bacterium]
MNRQRADAKDAKPEFEGGRYLAENEDRLAWIMGSSRSGSTWMLRMLTDEPSVVGIDDPHLGHHLGVWRPLPLAWATAEERPRLKTLADVKREKPGYMFSERYRDAWLPALKDLVRARFGAQLADELDDGVERPTVVVKEPGSQAAELLLGAFPESRLIFLLRDGRDVVDSWIDAYQNGSWAIEEGAFPVAAERRLALVEWLATVWAYRTRVVARAYARHPRERRVLIRYEDLLEGAEAELARAFGALGIESPATAVSEIAERNSYELVSPDRRGPRHEIRAASPGSWRHNLDASEQRAMHEIMGSELEAFGYLGPDRSARAA